MADLDRETQARLFDAFADNYAQAVNDSISASGEDVVYFARLKARLMAQLSESRSMNAVLDFGCGTGMFTQALALELPEGVVLTGADPSAASIGVARNNARTASLAALKSTQFFEITGDRLPFPDATFSDVAAANVFHHIDRADHIRCLREIARVLKPGGTLWVFEHNPANPLTRRAVRECAFDEGVVLLDPGYLAGAMSAVGLTSMAAHYYFFFPRLLAWLRPFETALKRVPLGAQFLMRGVRGR